MPKMLVLDKPDASYKHRHANHQHPFTNHDRAPKQASQHSIDGLACLRVYLWIRKPTAFRVGPYDQGDITYYLCGLGYRQGLESGDMDMSRGIYLC